jgi:hypothetical protein
MFSSTRMVSTAREAFRQALFLAVSAIVMTGAAQAGPQSLLGGGVFKRADSALIDRSSASAAMIPAPQPASLTTSGGGSLFSGREEGSLFALRPAPARRMAPITDFGVDGLRQLIASAEAGKADYDAVQHGAVIKTPKPPTRMTIREIYAWIDATPGQPHAIGRYQFIPSTLRRVVRELGLSLDERFTPRIQDLCADILLEDAGLSAFLHGEMSQKAFMNNLAKIWAGLPNATGRSHYHGYAGNRAVMTWAQFETGMSRIFPRG